MKNTIESVVSSFSQIYPQHTNFFNKFVKEFKTHEDYNQCTLGYCEEEYEVDEECEGGYTDEEIIDEYWYPELEVYMLQQVLNEEFPGGEVWCDFKNSLLETEWYEEN